MKSLLLIFILLAMSEAGAPASCSTKEQLQTCVFTFVDADNDGNVTLSELDHFIMYDPCDARPTRTTGLSVMQRCDKDEDGVISEGDFTHERSCANILGMVRIGCRICDKCNGVLNGARGVEKKRADVKQALEEMERRRLK